MKIIACIYTTYFINDIIVYIVTINTVIIYTMVVYLLFMTHQEVLEWSIVITDTNPANDDEYLTDAKGGRLILSQNENTRRQMDIARIVVDLVCNYRGLGYALTVDKQDLNKISIQCGPMKAWIMSDGLNGVTTACEEINKLNEVE